jgi:hypothetical protein
MWPRKIGAAELTERSFPPPWIVEELEACFYVCDSAGQKLAYVYFEDDPGRRAAAKLLAKDEARRIAANIAKLAGDSLLAKGAIFWTACWLGCATGASSSDGIGF